MARIRVFTIDVNGSTYDAEVLIVQGCVEDVFPTLKSGEPQADDDVEQAVDVLMADLCATASRCE